MASPGNTRVSEGAGLLSELSEFVTRFVTLTQTQADLCALWVMHTHAIDETDFTPYLNIHSAVLRSGKTRLLEVLRMLVNKPWYTGRVTGSALVRKTDRDHSTLLLDESDTAFQAKGDYPETLRGILNSGFERDGTYSMSVQKGKDWEPRDFSTFSAKAIAGIGRLPDTVEDRALPIRLKRALRNDPHERLRKRKIRPEAERLRERVISWIQQSASALRGAEPQLPDELNDRQQDVCEPVLAIADLAGGEWPIRARRALVDLCTGRAKQDDSAGVKLLGDLRKCFEKHHAERLRTTALLADLKAFEESPWAEFQRGSPLTASGLARLLRPFDIWPHDLRFEHGVLKGYLRADFEDSWMRYLPAKAEQGQQGRQAAIDAGLPSFREGQQTSVVAPGKNVESPINTLSVAGVAPTGGKNGSTRCYVHPRNQTDWWERKDGTEVCGLCHPNPAEG